MLHEREPTSSPEDFIFKYSTLRQQREAFEKVIELAKLKIQIIEAEMQNLENQLKKEGRLNT